MWGSAVRTGHVNGSRPRQRLARSPPQPPCETARRCGEQAMLLKWGRRGERWKELKREEGRCSGARMTPGQGRRREGDGWS
ncbi:hypothetical protein B0H12DRAFT_1155068 [Mycena haematopus]|nr:hypothetical protein B0H12DRAFT_1155068 [Mycena haematopus]